MGRYFADIDLFDLFDPIKLTVGRTDSQKPPFTITTNLVYQLYDSFIILVFSHKIYCNRLSGII